MHLVIKLSTSYLACSHAKLSELVGSRRQQLAALKDKLVMYRERSQRLGKIYGEKAPPGPATPKIDHG